ncbi:MAG: hypothetical protein H6723_19590 [Sandaracinus sp.]|nr:hypothetical protein [Sandaracinus sp.]
MRFAPAAGSRWLVDAVAVNGSPDGSMGVSMRLVWEVESVDEGVVTVREEIRCASAVPHVRSPDGQVWRYRFDGSWGQAAAPESVESGDRMRRMVQLLLPELREAAPELAFAEGPRAPGETWERHETRERTTTMWVQPLTLATTYTMVERDAETALVHYEGTMGPDEITLVGNPFHLEGRRFGVFRARVDDGMLACADLQEEGDLNRDSHDWTRRITLRVEPLEGEAPGCETARPIPPCAP